MGRRSSGNPKPAFEKTESAFVRQMQKAAKAILKEAGGRTCGGCMFYTGTTCQIHLSPTSGSNLEINNPEAPACKDWSEKGHGSR